MNNIIITNAKIYTMDKNNSKAEAMYIKGSKIEVIGGEQDVLAHAVGNELIIDANGKTIIPGLIDSHMHVYSYGKSLRSIDLTGVKSIDDMINKVESFLKNNTLIKGLWVEGRGWNQELFKINKMPTKEDLDKISFDIPIVLTRVCGHICLCNSKALNLMNITAETTVDGGEIEIGENGQCTGILKENALNLLKEVQPKPSLEKIKSDINNALSELIKYGITGVHTDDLQHAGGDWEKVIQAYKELEEANKLKVRINQQCLFFEIDKYKNFLDKGFKTGEGNNFFKIGPLKLLGDGSLGARTAYLSEPYHDDPSVRGITLYTQEQLDELVKVAHDNDMPVAIHAIGDGMMQMAIESIKKAQTNNYKDNIRHGIVHCQITTEELFDKYKENNIAAYIQPIFVASDYEIVSNRIGKEKEYYTYNWKRFFDRDIITSFGTDCPVESPNPFENIYCAVTRQNLDGKPNQGWLPEQKLSVVKSVKGYTINSAYMSYDEDKLGTLEKGKLADLIMISNDVFEIPENQIKSIECLMTIVNGELVYKKRNNTI